MSRKYFFTAGRFSLLLSGVLFLSCVTSYAQSSDNLGSTATSVLLEKTKDLLKDNKPAALIPYLQEIMVRVSGMNDEDSLQARAFCMYQIGVCQMQTRQYSAAIESLDLFLKAFPQDSNATSASMLLAECYSIRKDWIGAEQYAKKMIEDTSMPAERRLSATQLLGEALFNQQKWSEAIEPLMKVFENTKDQNDRSRASLMLVTCYVKEKDFPNFLKFLDFCDGVVRQHAALNLALIEAGDQKYRDKDFANALVLYQSVLRKNERMDLLQKRIDEIEAFIAAPYKVTVGGSSSIHEKEVAKKKLELERRTKQLKKIKSGRSYDVDLALRIAQTYDEMDRDVPAYTIYRDIYTKSPNHELAETARYKAMSSMLDLNKLDRAIEEAAGYLQLYRNGKYADEVSLNQMQAYLQLNQFDEAQLAGLNALKWSPNHRYKDQIKYLLGYTYFQQMDYKEALRYFKEVFEKWPNGVYREASEYWTAMSYLFLGDFNEAIRAFEAYLKSDEYPVRQFAEDASYRLGIAYYGIGDYDKSEAIFRRFIDTYPDSDLESEALSMLGDLLGAKGFLSEALGFYRKAREVAVSIAQVDYATFQAAKTYELEDRYNSIIELMDNYLREYGDRGNFASAHFWMGKAYKAMGQDRKALAVYLEAIVSHGNDLKNNDVDLILLQLIKECSGEEGQVYKRSLRGRLAAEIRRAKGQKETTLQLRLETLGAYITDGNLRQSYMDAIFAVGNLRNAGPLTLRLMATESAEKGDAKKVDEIYKYCLRNYKDSEVLVDIMNLQLQMIFEKGDYKEVIKFAEDMSDRFGYRKQIGITRKLKADAYRLLGQYDEAIKTYKELFAVRSWRGPLTPEALYWIGDCLYKKGDIEEALTYFTRVSVMYDKYTEWMVKAYDASFKCLEKLGKTDELIAGYKAMLENEAAAATPEGIRARASLDKLLLQQGGSK